MLQEAGINGAYLEHGNMGNASYAQSSAASKVYGSMREEIEIGPLCALKALAQDDTD